MSEPVSFGEAPARSGRATLLLFTTSYPWDVGQEATFIEPELPSLAEAFQRVIVIPRQIGGRRSDLLPLGVVVEAGLARHLSRHPRRIRTTFRALVSDLAWRHFLRSPRLPLRAKALRRLVVESGRAAMTADWVTRFLKSRALEPDACLAYTFWLDSSTVGLANVKRAHPSLAIVTRTHGGDVITEQHDAAFLPNVDVALRAVDRVFGASSFITEYVRDRHPAAAVKCEVAHLGVPDPGFAATSSAPGLFTVVSCSGITANKRVELICAAIAAFARQTPELAIEWHHFGDGEHRGSVSNLAAQLPRNAKPLLHGHQDVRTIMAFYASHAVDAFVSASLVEGGAPVAIQEAASCGIPVIATDSGGARDIVSTRNGILVEPSEAEQGIIRGLSALYRMGGKAESLRAGSRSVWAEGFDAARNSTAFATRLREVT